jgi:hypothetical protein
MVAHRVMVPQASHHQESELQDSSTSEPRADMAFSRLYTCVRPRSWASDCDGERKYLQSNEKVALVKFCTVNSDDWCQVVNRIDGDIKHSSFKCRHRRSRSC